MNNQSNSMIGHVHAVAILHIIAGVLGVLGGLTVFLVLGGAGAVVGFVGELDEVGFIVPLLMILGLLIAGFIFLTSVPGIIAGAGLLKYENWARILTIIISILYIPLHVPFGTILGIYSIWVLFTPETEALFRNSGNISSPPAANSSIANDST